MKVKNTILFVAALFLTIGISWAQPQKKQLTGKAGKIINPYELKTGAENHNAYFPLLKGKRVGVMTNQTGVVTVEPQRNTAATAGKNSKAGGKDTLSLVDFLLDNKVNVMKIYAPEHGFRGTADAGELIKDGKDTKTGLPIISLYGKSKKPTKEQLNGIDILIFDLQDVGARFFTYISSLHYVMEACAENNVPLMILDRPNPNGTFVEGPVLEKEYQSFVGMHPIPVLHGMTIGEYGQMINGEKWLKNGIQCALTVIPCLNYDKTIPYSLPVKPSPNLPNDQAVNLYVSLCFFEGTNVSSGRGTDKQFQVYGSPFLVNMPYRFTPQPNEGAKDPMNKGKICYGEDLSEIPRIEGIQLKWLLKAYAATPKEHKKAFFTAFFENLAGTKLLREQIEKGLTETEIKKSWEKGIADFRKIRAAYLLYPDEK